MAKVPPRGIPGAVSAIFMDRAWRTKDDDPAKRIRIEVIVDKVLDDAEKGDHVAQKLAFEYIQGKPGPTLTEEQALLMAINISPERKAELANMSVAEFMDRQLLALQAGDIIEVEK